MNKIKEFKKNLIIYKKNNKEISKKTNLRAIL